MIDRSVVVGSLRGEGLAEPVGVCDVTEENIGMRHMELRVWGKKATDDILHEPRPFLIASSFRQTLITKQLLDIYERRLIDIRHIATQVCNAPRQEHPLIVRQAVRHGRLGGVQSRGQ